ncbi:hypothetical protein CPB86DRAFT_781032 [Serendipita vermifera]|nr:hypothetical protein CPB86DRAFT_781032 [Serendipita vermifera]
MQPEPRFSEEHFSIDGSNGLLTITTTDKAHGFEPPPVIAEKVKEGLGTKRYWYQKLSVDSPTHKYWRSHIGNALVHQFLLIDPGGDRKFMLSDFPPGYCLYAHNVGTQTRHADIRKDCYLFGGNHKFRSTHEAMFHLAWLMRGMPPGRCRCVYDTPIRGNRRKQGDLNRNFKQEMARFWNDRRKKHYDEQQAAKARGETWHAPEPRNVFNDQCFLLPERSPTTSTSLARTRA